MSSEFLPASHDDRRASALYVARRYYVDNATMESIGRELGASRSTISRLLTYARESGLVEIRFLPDKPLKPDIHVAIETTYDVVAHIVPASASVSEGERLARTASYAARVIYSIVDSDMVVAVSWGTMIDQVSKRLIPKPVSNCQIVQLNGYGNTTTNGLHYANSIMYEFSQAFNGYVQQFPIPIFFDTSATRDALFSERSIQRIQRLQYGADVAIFNIGTVDAGEPNHPYLAGYFIDEQDIAGLAQDDAVGELAGRYFKPDGGAAGIGLNDRTSGPDLDRLKNVEHRLCITSGNRKVAALQAALHGGYITDLVIDEVTAHLLLRHDAGSGSQP